MSNTSYEVSSKGQSGKSRNVSVQTVIILSNAKDVRFREARPLATKIATRQKWPPAA